MSSATRRNPGRPATNRSWIARAVAGIAAIAPASEARAESRHTAIDLVWTAPPECPSRDAVVDEIDQWIGGADRGAGSLAVSVETTRAGDQFVARALFASARGLKFRVYRGNTCAEIVDAVSLLIAMLVEGDETGTGALPPVPASVSAANSRVIEGAAEEPPVAPPASALVVRPPRDTKTSESTSGSRAARAVAIRLTASAGIDGGTLPAVGARVGAGAAIVLHEVRAEVGLSVFPDREKNAEGSNAAGGSIGLFEGRADLCRLWAWSRFEAGPCASFEIGRMKASGFGVSHPDSVHQLFAAAGAGVRATFFFPSTIGLFVALEGAVPLTRPMFVLENVGPVFRPAAWVGRVGGGVEARF